MSEDERLTLEEAHLWFAKSLNGATWDLLGKPERSVSEDEEMVLAATASLYHWLQVGSGVHAQRWALAARPRLQLCSKNQAWH